jgi:hypothetical protein
MSSNEIRTGYVRDANKQRYCCTELLDKLKRNPINFSEETCEQRDKICLLFDKVLCKERISMQYKLWPLIFCVY